MILNTLVDSNESGTLAQCDSFHQPIEKTRSIPVGNIPAAVEKKKFMV
jgi:hypothetical protein